MIWRGARSIGPLHGLWFPSLPLLLSIRRLDHEASGLAPDRYLGLRHAVRAGVSGNQVSGHRVSNPLLTSVTRIASFRREALEAAPAPRDQWRAGDYVLGRVLSPASGGWIEAVDGRNIELVEGDLVVGVLGKRHATLESTGDWEKIGDDLVMQALGEAGVFGRCTSLSQSEPRPVDYLYEGHILLGERPARMEDFALVPGPAKPTVPVILLIGTSMSAGKTASGKTIVRALNRRGLRVGGTKLTGIASYRDILGMGDAGADVILDFVDAGLPSTVCDREVFEPALASIMSTLAREDIDVVVAEAGASPLEPYNGDTVLDALREVIALTVLCASDPYAVVGITHAFGIRPDVVAGLCTSTRAGIELCERLSEAPVLNLVDRASIPALEAILDHALGSEARPR